MYNQIFNPYQYNQNQGIAPVQQQIVKVTGENGARAYNMLANSSALLLDETAPIVWLVQTDGAGYKTINPYKIEPYKPEPTDDYKSLEERIKRLEVLINESNTSDASNK